MEKHQIIISPKTKVGDLLDCYPELEIVLMEMSPAFEKLRNPILRKTVARVASLSQIAVVGGLKVEDIVNRLRMETRQEGNTVEEDDTGYLTSGIPDWLLSGTVTEVFDATPVINSGESPMSSVLEKSYILRPGEILEFHTPFIPAPIIDILRGKNYLVFISREGDIFKTRVSK